LTDYVTNQALNGVFKMVAVEEKNIRTNLSARTSVLLQRVFALQDKRYNSSYSYPSHLKITQKKQQ
jgi:hypothetical protein